MDKTLSIIVPVHNEQDALVTLHEEIQAAVIQLKRPYEIIYVNDGSTDQSLAVLKNLKGATIIDLNRRYGQATALDAGFKAAEGDIIISLDGDGQNDPKEIPLLLAELARGSYDVVAGWRKSRKDRSSIRILTRIGRWFRKLFIGHIVHDSGCTFRVYTRKAAKSLDIQGEMHRYIVTLLRWKGYRIGEVVVTDRPRASGTSKYGASKALRGFIDLVYIWFIYKYSQRPLHLFGYLSFGAFLIGFLSLLWTLYGKLVFGLSLNRNGWFFISFFFLLAGILLFSFGIIIDLLIRIQLTTSPHEKRYYVREVVKT
ncbi:MAG: glycosyltransferase family 2 protein [Minisyncoccia bacterium]|jgi:glycosyltransferase involved in cell wall biosynthesis